jgi:transposase
MTEAYEIIDHTYDVGTRKTMIVALARKLLIALWRLVTGGEVPQGVVLRPVS